MLLSSSGEYRRTLLKILFVVPLCLFVGYVLAEDETLQPRKMFSAPPQLNRAQQGRPETEARQHNMYSYMEESECGLA